MAALLILPAGVLAPMLATPTQCLAMYALFVFAGSMPFGCAGAAFQDLTPNQMRAQVTALYFFALNLCGIGLGPTVVATFTDKVFHADAAVGDSLAVVIGLAAPVSAWLLWCSLKPYRRALTENQHLGEPS